MKTAKSGSGGKSGGPFSRGRTSARIPCADSHRMHRTVRRIDVNTATKAVRSRACVQKHALASSTAMNNAWSLFQVHDPQPSLINLGESH